MGNRLSLELSDGLTELSALFTEYEHEPRILDPEDARTIRACISELRAAARRLENEISARRWNEEARKDRAAELRRAIAEIERPGSNVTPFPVIARPFSDGHPRGAA